VDRFAFLLFETGVPCYAWALLSNHFHLLLMPTSTSLSSFMRRLLTGYAVSFNRRYQQSGHLFQNRYKSIVFEEEPYLLELVRYIHLNPLRAGIVENLEELDRYRWSGHAVLLGGRSFSGQETDSILARFGNKLTIARRNYHRFVADGIKDGHRNELVSGGLKRSQGERLEDEYEVFDERVLGSGEFVESLRGDVQLQEKMQMVTLPQLLEAVSAAAGVEPASVKKPSKKRGPTTARGIICHLAMFEFGYSGSEVGRFLHLGSSGVSLAARRGERLVNAVPETLKRIFSSTEK
jgi:putative transposase